MSFPCALVEHLLSNMDTQSLVDAPDTANAERAAYFLFAKAMKGIQIARNECIVGRVIVDPDRALGGTLEGIVAAAAWCEVCEGASSESGMDDACEYTRFCEYAVDDGLGQSAVARILYGTHLIICANRERITFRKVTAGSAGCIVPEHGEADSVNSHTVAPTEHISFLSRTRLQAQWDPALREYESVPPAHSIRCHRHAYHASAHVSGLGAATTGTKFTPATNSSPRPGSECRRARRDCGLHAPKNVGGGPSRRHTTGRECAGVSVYAGVAASVEEGECDVGTKVGNREWAGRRRVAAEGVRKRRRLQLEWGAPWRILTADILARATEWPARISGHSSLARGSARHSRIANSVPENAVSSRARCQRRTEEPHATQSARAIHDRAVRRSSADARTRCSQVCRRTDSVFAVRGVGGSRMRHGESWREPSVRSRAFDVALREYNGSRMRGIAGARGSGMRRDVARGRETRPHRPRCYERNAERPPSHPE
ncbi:hypothetical protein C8R44DRAFT_940968 [Mycena epipterygia]|nr:hypothetical protein C8R44DRAFT_940968 [Mycena epipterygia]